jgi:RHS repeat-associated protein
MLRPRSSQSSFYGRYLYDKIVHQNHLSSTSVMTDDTGDSMGAIKYLPFGECRNSPPYPTDILFTGQRLDETGLYYYNARYYDPTIGRFISADTIVPDPMNPQAFNRYSYCLNNPLKYIDPSGHGFWGSLWDTVKGFGKGFVNFLEAGSHAIMNPMDTLKSLSVALCNPMDTLEAIINDYSTKMQTNEGRGEIVFDIAITLFTLGSGGAAIKGSKAIKLSRQATEVARLVTQIEKELYKLTKGKITGFANDAGDLIPHGLSRMSERGFSVDDVINIVNKGERIVQTNGNIAFYYNKARVILLTDGRFLTVFGHRP